jgi:aquaporin Z
MTASPAARALHDHWREYAIEAALLGAFMVSACTFGTLVFRPVSPVHRALGTPWTQRLTMGALMGLTSIALVYSPWGKRSGGHLNPAFTLTFLRLGRVARWDAAFYVAAQFVGAVVGVLLSARVLGMSLGDPAVRYVVTQPGPAGVLAAFAAEVAISAGLMTLVLHTAASPRLARFTGLFAGLLVATYITLESPISGMSMNPARTFGSAAAAWSWTAIWVYFTAPLLGMLLAAELYRRRERRIPCAKYRHVRGQRCIFCEYAGEWDVERPNTR